MLIIITTKLYSRVMIHPDDGHVVHGLGSPTAPPSIFPSA
jgi:hypothetical protein